MRQHLISTIHALDCEGRGQRAEPARQSERMHPSRALEPRRGAPRAPHSAQGEENKGGRKKGKRKRENAPLYSPPAPCPPARPGHSRTPPPRPARSSPLPLPRPRPHARSAPAK
ncbi:hypothetical protein CALCODRAFT_325320 [Calocera cornea HHB12733]|uniref:Uncharacterized protein n=1 Tax=Calocera cornea HHB12733 TaxID=1353952 RepID=A0A165F4P8_9BASI|nr:hypothetical protein CALCODRAFT_325320 [Calocera cornea HHB12733]